MWVVMVWLLAAIGFWVFLGLAGVAPMVILWFAKYEPVEDEGPYFARAGAVFEAGWLERNGFEPACVLQPLSDPLVFYRHRDGQTVLGVYLMQIGTHTDFVTEFAQGVGLTTGDSSSSHSLPHDPRSLTQGLPGWDHEQRWRAHQEAKRLIESELRLPFEEVGPVELAFEAAIRQQARYVLKRPWLVLTVPYRYFVTRHRLKGVSVMEQVERGRIDLRALADRLRGMEM